MSILTLPGLIDPHVHLRDPGQTHKEDFFTGTSAALAGGYTTVLDMPNNAEPITTQERLNTKMASARTQIVCDVGFNFGTLGDNFEEFAKVANDVMALKVYMNVTTGNFIVDGDRLIGIYKAWLNDKPIMLHAEDDVSEIVMKTLKEVPKATHICHVSSEAELTFVMKAKEAGLPISCGVTPHHLFLSEKEVDRLGPLAQMKPSLKSQKDIDFLWNHMDAIDIIESDHAPHTKEEKAGDPAPFGVPGLETTLPLMLTAQQEGKITLEKLQSLLHDRAAEIFHITQDENTKIEVDLAEYTISDRDLKTKCGWTPFAGQRVVGRVSNVYLRGTKVFENGAVLAEAGSGRLLSAN